MEITAAFDGQARACRDLGSPMYADLLDRLAEDLRARGPSAAVLLGHEDDPGPSALALRLLGSVHRLVLQRRAGSLAAYYPSVGGTFEPHGAGAALLALLAEQPESVREWLDRPPQTNEPGRSAALIAGLLALEPGSDAVVLPVRLFEIGSSAGLNLLGDRFRFGIDGGTWAGPTDSPVAVAGAWHGPGPWASSEGRWPLIVDRVGSDLRPVDVATTEGRLALTAYVWADQLPRLERLRGALELARQNPLEVRGQGAAAFVEDLELRSGTTTVLWHSVMWQYLAAAEQARITERVAALGARASAERRFAHLRLEPARRRAGEQHDFWLVLEQWPEPAAGGRHRFLARVGGHGVPVVWAEPEEAGTHMP